MNEELLLELVELGITQKEFSKSVGITENALSRIINGKAKPRKRTELLIKKALEEARVQ